MVRLVSRVIFLACIGTLILSTFIFAGETIKVGVVDTYSGGAAVFGIDMLDGFKMGVNEINAKGGVVGKKIEFVARDEKFKPELALSMAKELVMKEKVDILMGTISSGSALAVSEYAKKEKIPFFVTYAKSEKISGEKGHRYVFTMGENTSMAGRAAAHRDVVPARWGELELSVEGDDTVDVGRWDAGDVADIVNGLFGDISIGVLRRLQKGNQRPRLTIVLP